MSYMNFGIWIPQGDTNKEELYSLLNNWFCYIEDKSLFDKVYNFCPDMWDKFLGYFSDIKCETLLNYNKAEKISNLKKAFDDVYFHADAELRPAEEEGIWIAWFRNDNLEELLPSESDLPDEITEADDEVAAYLEAYSEELMNLDIIHFISQGALEMKLEEYEEDEEINKLLNEEQ